MTREEIIKSVREYVRDDMAQYAILIDSPWGSGKTYLYEHHLVDAVTTAVTDGSVRENIYISLYGIATIDALAKQLMTNFMLHIKWKKGNNSKEVLNAANGMFAIASKAVSVSINDMVSMDLSKFSTMKELSKVKNFVICFDDLERCTIPVDEVLGFIDNLIEHCGCKIIILADEENIGKIYTNSNLELKYLSLLIGGKSLLGESEEEGGKSPKKKDISSISVDDLKKLNENVYSVNYVYKDIREKVIGKTLPYYPSLKETILEVINGDPSVGTAAYVKDDTYRKFLLDHIDRIEKSFMDTDNRNLRIFLRWIDRYKDIYTKTKEAYGNAKLYENVVDSFLQYSIWLSGAIGKNKKLAPWNSGLNVDYIVFEGKENEHIMRHRFIDEWITKAYWDDQAFNQSAKQVINLEEQESLRNKKIKSTGKALGELQDWRIKTDDEVELLTNKLTNELKEGMYSYMDYQNIIDLLLYLRKMKLYSRDIKDIQKTMLNLIDQATECQEIGKMPRTFVSEADRKLYMEIYGPIEARIDEKNREINIAAAVDNNKYESADKFAENCADKKDYYIEHRSFTEFISIDRIVELLRKSSLEDIYKIKKAFQVVYDRTTINQFYMKDISELRRLKEMVSNREFFPVNGRTREIAIESFTEMLEQVMTYLGA
ncbi:MAG: KAP family NTPase [Lachnospiraceae bacterium]|nr:KAP family NTPase [Lachnospiraceae bacterium]